jgi:hypothetical protein
LSTMRDRFGRQSQWETTQGSIAYARSSLKGLLDKYWEIDAESLRREVSFVRVRQAQAQIDLMESISDQLSVLSDVIAERRT